MGLASSNEDLCILISEEILKFQKAFIAYHLLKSLRGNVYFQILNIFSSLVLKRLLILNVCVLSKLCTFKISQSWYNLNLRILSSSKLLNY